MQQLSQRSQPHLQQHPPTPRLRRVRCSAASAPAAADRDWRSKAKPIQPGSSYPAKEFCSHCGLCDTYYVAHVKVGRLLLLLWAMLVGSTSQSSSSLLSAQQAYLVLGRPCCKQQQQ